MTDDSKRQSADSEVSETSVDETAEPIVKGPAASSEPPAAEKTVVDEVSAEPAKPPRIKIGSQRDGAQASAEIKARPQKLPPGRNTAAAMAAGPAIDSAQEQVKSYPPPRLEPKITPDMQREFDAAMGDLALDDLMESAGGLIDVELEEGDKTKGRVLAIRNDSVFVDLGRRNQGLVPVKQFEEIPEAGAMIDVVVSRFDAEEGVYELVMPDAAVDIGGWDELSQGMVVEAVVTGHNKGGLEVEVNRLKGFVPISQVALYRIEDLEEFAGQRFACVVTEVNPDRRNLVLSRRAILERERAESKKKLLDEIQVGQQRDGIVTRLQPFGAFVDLGGIDGLIHISQLSWDRVAHPNEVLTEGQKVTVQVAKIDRDTGKIGLAYRDAFENPWNEVENRYRAKTRVTGTVSRLMDFGAFVRLEAGVEGLIHVSELAHRRVFRPGDVLSEGQEVDVLVLSVDPQAQRISLSLKALEAGPQSEAKKKDADEDVPVASPPLPKSKREGNLKGGTNKSSGGDQFGLKW